MKSSIIVKYRSILIAVFIIISSTAFTINKNELSGQKDPVKLVYNLAVGKSVTYASSTVINQAMDINGQTMNTLVNNDLGFKVKTLGKTDGNLKLEITIDSINVKIESPNGSTGSKIKDVIGKSFNILLSPDGKEVDLSEAAKIEYSVEGGGSANLSSTFIRVFPHLPPNAVKPGDSWINNDTISNKSSTTKTSQIVQSSSKFEGIEKINGVECAKISSIITGTMEISTQNMGMDIFYGGPFQGTVTLYFAVKEGYFISQETFSKMTGNMQISGPQNMTFPMVMDTKNKIEVRK
jgi:hypothetical protein